MNGEKRVDPREASSSWLALSDGWELELRESIASFRAFRLRLSLELDDLLGLGLGE